MHEGMHAYGMLEIWMYWGEGEAQKNFEKDALF